MSNRAKRQAPLTTLAPYVVAIDGVRGGRPVIANGRLGPDSPWAFWDPRRPQDVDVAMREYPGLTREQAIAAIAFECGRQYERHEGVDERRAQLRELINAAIDDVLGTTGEEDDDA